MTIEKVINENIESIKELALDLTKEVMIRPYPSNTIKKIVVDEASLEIEVVELADIRENIEGKHTLFTAVPNVGLEVFKLDDTKDLRDLLSYNDFNKFIKLYAEDEGISIEKALESNEQFNLALLYFLDRDMHKKYAGKQVDKFLKGSVFELNEDLVLKIVKPRKNMKLLVTSPGGNASKNATRVRVSLPTDWILKMGLDKDNRQVDLSFTGDSIVIKKDDFEFDINSL